MLGSEVGSLAILQNSPKKTMQESVEGDDKQQKAMEIQRQVWEQRRQFTKSYSNPSNGSCGEKAEEEDCKSAVNSLLAKEQEIERRKLEVAEKVQAHLNRVEEEARQLDQIRRELEGLGDPIKKEISEIRKKIEVVDRELKPLKQTRDRKEKEYKAAVEAFNEKSRLKAELITALMEIVTESEKLRMRKLDEGKMTKTIPWFHVMSLEGKMTKTIPHIGILSLFLLLALLLLW